MYPGSPESQGFCLINGIIHGWIQTLNRLLRRGSFTGGCVLLKDVCWPRPLSVPLSSLFPRGERLSSIIRLLHDAPASRQVWRQWGHLTMDWNRDPKLVLALLRHSIKQRKRDKYRTHYMTKPPAPCKGPGADEMLGRVMLRGKQAGGRRKCPSRREWS